MKNTLLGVLVFFSLQAVGKEELLGVYFDQDGITFQVKSSGCTSKEHFSFVVLDTFPAGLMLNREIPDLCGGHEPYGTMIKFTYEEFGFTQDSEFKILNTLSTIRVQQAEGINR